MNNKSPMQKCLIVGLVTSLCVAAGVSDVLSAFIRTNTSGTTTSECGFGYGYDSVSGYGNGYGPVCLTPSNSTKKTFGGNGGSKSSSSSNVSKPNTNSGSTTKPNTKSNNQKPTGNPYGSNYVNLDDGLSTTSPSALDSDIIIPSSTAITTNTSSVGSTATITTTTTIKRMMPATGIN